MKVGRLLDRLTTTRSRSNHDGLAEYADRYREVAGELSAHGISTFAFDQRGHGKAPGTRTHVDRFEQFVDDVSLASRAIQGRFPGLPLFIWGHSMGSIVVLAAAAAGSCSARGVITTSNSLELFRRTPDQRARCSELQPGSCRVSGFR